MHIGKYENVESLEASISSLGGDQEGIYKLVKRNFDKLKDLSNPYNDRTSFIQRSHYESEKPFDLRKKSETF